MNTPSSSNDQFTNKKLHEPSPTRRELPYQSLLRQLRTMSSEVSFPMEIFITWRPKFELTPDMRHQIWILQRELMLLQMAFILLQNHGVLMSQELNSIQPIAERVEAAAKGFNAYQDFEARSSYFGQWESTASLFQLTIDQKIKPCLKKFCFQIVDGLLQGNYSSGEYDFFGFIYIILLKLKDIANFKANMIAPVKKRMEILRKMLHFAISGKQTSLNINFKNFLVYVRPWVNVAAALVILYWVDENDEELFSMVSPSFQKFNLVGAYIEYIKALKPSNASEILSMRETIGCLTGLVLENIVDSTDDRFEMLREQLILWTALLVNPPQSDAEDDKLICKQTNLLVKEAESLIHSLCLNKLGEDIADRRNILLNDFLEKMSQARVEVTHLHVEKIPGFSWNNVPLTNRRGFFDFLLGNLQMKFESEANKFPFEKSRIELIHKELSCLRPFLMGIFELQDEHKELRDIWVQASNVAYLVDYVTDSCLSSIDVPIWSNLMHLSNAVEQIQLLKTKVSKIRWNATTKDDTMVGFADEEQRIINQLIAGEVGLEILAIVGMPGQGKTTLAQRVSQDSYIKRHFNKYAWCCISQAYDIKMILKDILENLGESVSPKEFHRLTEQDMADRLRKRLKGQRYLVVLDDMWDDKAWYEVQLSFPDDNNGSRILLTSRNRDVALKVKADCSIVELHPLTDEESWNLLQMKVFEEDCCPPTLSDVGKTIAENCKGLPLAIVVAAGLLKKDKDLNSWKQISERLHSQMAREEVCMNVLDLSYKNLPDYLRPCFLYLGTFQEDQIIDAKQLIQFWIAEGFVQDNGMKTMEILAKEYLVDLVSRSLVFIAQRSSRNGIKKCRVHDLLRQLCLTKAEEESFLLVPNEVSNSSSGIRCDHYRLCVHDKRGFDFLHSNPIAPTLRSLLFSMTKFDIDDSYFAPGFLKGFKLIRVLDLSDAFVTEADFRDITQLIHLRLLAVDFRFSSIPSSIVNLLRLEVLRFRYVGTPMVLTSAVFKMANLRHIFAKVCTIQFKYTEDFDVDMMVPDLSPPLTSLETLNSVLFPDQSSFEWVAQKLPDILKLGLMLFFCVPLSRYFKMLESLNLCIQVQQPLETEAISPSILDFPLTLKKLNLTVLSYVLSGAMISSIGKLRNLQVLKLQAQFENGRWDVEDDEFLKLKYFELRLSSILEWNASDESFPCLEQLVIRECDKLGHLPGRFGSLTTLNRIEVSNCSDRVSDSFQQIVHEQMDSGNEGLRFSIS